jgi:hypothetical protein
MERKETSPAEQEAKDQVTETKVTNFQTDVETGDINGSEVTAAGRDVNKYNGNVFVNVHVGATSDDLEETAKHIGRNVQRALKEADEERKRDKKLEEQGVEYQKKRTASDSSEVEQWFQEDLSTVREKYFAITLSLFNGLKWADLWDIYQSILEASGILEEETKKSNREPFSQTDQELVEKARARIVRKDDQAAEVVEFKNDDYAAVVVELMRCQYRPRLVELLPGLGSLGTHPYWEIRARAAYAVAEIAKMDFYRARRQVLENWAQDNRAYVRAAVGYTATRLIEDGIADAEAQKMLNEWGDPQANRGWKFRWTAAAAYKQIGLEDAELALNSLKEIARNDDIRVADAVIYALLVISFNDKLKTVLTTLGDWLDEAKEPEEKANVVPLVATLAFLTLGSAYTSQAEREPDDGEETEEDKFLLLLTTDTDGLWHSVVLSALSKTVTYNLTDEAFGVLKGWARQTNGRNEQSSTLRDLIADWYMKMWREGHQIGMCGALNRLERWTQDGNQGTKNVAQVTLREIKKRINVAPLPSSSQSRDAQKTITFG